MLIPPLLSFKKVEDYKRHYVSSYCCEKIFTFDGVRVFFRQERFAHAFYEASAKDGKKDIFSWERAQRMDWIKLTLENPKADIYQGWDKKKRIYDEARRISVVYEDFVVIIDITKRKLDKSPDESKFITAYPADRFAIKKIRNAPRWK